MLPRRTAVGCLLLFGLMFCHPASGTGQSVRVSVPEENFRKEARVTSSNRLATVFEGAVLGVESRQARWILATLEGWIWTPSLSATDRDGFDLVVSAPGGENLREAPDGEARRVARLLRGMLLDQVERRGNWTLVRRSAWLWSESVVEVEADRAAAPALPDATPAEADDGPAAAAAELPERIVVTGSSVQMLVSPSGDTLASLMPEADLEVLARQGSWARVRLEGWVWVPSTVPADSILAGADLRPQDVAANPDQYRGRQVSWRLQFVSVERAEPAREDFYEGEPFILARALDGDQGFVYVAVPPELLPDVNALRPLQRIEVLGRIRTGRSVLMGVPVLDLVALN